MKNKILSILLMLITTLNQIFFLELFNSKNYKLAINPVVLENKTGIQLFIYQQAIELDHIVYLLSKLIASMIYYGNIYVIFLLLILSVYVKTNKDVKNNE